VDAKAQLNLGDMFYIAAWFQSLRHFTAQFKPA